jgi:hypothetical protein
MQAQNVAMVDGYLRELETDLLREYIELERTPVPSTLFVAALSQMWVFAIYELLRTWRQMTREIVEKSLQGKAGIAPSPRRKSRKMQRPLVSEELAETFYERPFRAVAADPAQVAALVEARTAMDPVFRRLTNLRIALAKHEIAGAKGVRAYAPGYSRIDMETGSIYWMVDRRDGASEIIARRDLADELASCRPAEEAG